MLLIRCLQTIVRFGGIWWIKVLASGGIGAAAVYYSKVREELPAWATKMLPEALALWVFVIIVAIWLIAALAFRLTQNESKQPKIYFEDPTVMPMIMGDPPNQYQTWIGHIRVRNRPISPAGEALKRAHSTVEIWDRARSKKIHTARGCRWTGNPKVRPDELPKFKEDILLKDLDANNALHDIDFLVKDPAESSVYAFRAESQMRFHLWKNPEDKVDGSEFWVHLMIEGAGLADAQGVWFVLKNETNSIRLIPEQVELDMAGLGTG